MEDIRDSKAKKRPRKSINLPLFALAMFLLGALVLVVLRYVTFKSDDVHYHANFALYINGQKDEFKNFTFYEEVKTCDVHDEDDVHGRAHMHDQNNHIVHVHAPGVTWGQFFANLGYTLGNEVIVTNKAVYVDGQDGNKLSFLLNGQSVQTTEDRLIKSEDVLLINYGKDDEKTLQNRFDAIPRDAQKANITPDPAACAGNESPGFIDRLKAAIGLPSD